MKSYFNQNEISCNKCAPSDYTGLDGAGREVELRHILVTPRRRAGLLQPCLGEKRRLQVSR